LSDGVALMLCVEMAQMSTIFSPSQSSLYFAGTKYHGETSLEPKFG